MRVLCWGGAVLLALAAHGVGERMDVITGKTMEAKEDASGKDVPPPEIFLPADELAKGLRGPDGIAIDPLTGEIYVSEENAAAIVRIKPNGARQVVIDATNPVYEEEDGRWEKVEGLRSPEGLALDGRGRLHVVEDVPGGRLIVFDLREKLSKVGVSGKVVSLPIEDSRYAWESIDLRPSGELLLAGSSMESFLGKGERGGLFRGAILYRDARGEWWMPLNHAMASYSAACFSVDGKYALFACEITGNVGCLDLQSHYLRTSFSEHVFNSPEGLCALPGGSMLVAEEGGKIYRLDPTTDSLQLIHDNAGTIETVAWGRDPRRVLITDDQRGALVSLALKAGLDFRASAGSIFDIPFEKRSTPVEMIPDQCPDYLAGVLALGGYDPNRGGKLTFRDFARRYCLISVDAEATLAPRQKPVEDPIRRIQFVIVAPYLIGYQEGELIWSSSGFTVVKESGETVKTGLVKRQIVHGDLLECRFTPVGGQTIALPMPFSARVNNEGHVSVNFMGMGVTPDFYLVLDTNDPDRSIMVVIQPDGFVQQYEVRLPANRDRSHWVVALERKEPDVWRNLSADPQGGPTPRPGPR